MSKKCARCEKTVYPTEELKCLDKIWHKPCFKCKECGMALNMRNYKGFDKEPYCDAHIPKAKATTMAETPELKRIAENTKIQSNVKYHADFEKSKGKFTQVADDPETLRIKQNTKIISNVAYHGDIQRKAEMEQKRHVNENGHPVVAMAPPLPPPNTQVTSSHGSLGQQQQNHHQQQQTSNTSSMSNNTSSSMMINAEKNSNMAASASLTHHQQSMMAAAAASAAPPYQPPPPIIPASQGGATGGPTTLPAPQHNSIGKISDYEPNSGNYASPYSSRNSQTLIYSSEAGSVNNPPPQRQIGSVHDMDPLNHNYGSLGRVYRAMYDYEAQDVDEVSFQDGDLIVNVRSIDGGWMTGEVQRTGQVGMLPANYVQLVNI